MTAIMTRKRNASAFLHRALINNTYTTRNNAARNNGARVVETADAARDSFPMKNSISANRCSSPLPETVDAGLRMYDLIRRN